VCGALVGAEHEVPDESEEIANQGQVRPRHGLTLKDAPRADFPTKGDHTAVAASGVPEW